MERKVSYLFEHHKISLLESLYALAITNPSAYKLKKGERFYDVQCDLTEEPQPTLPNALPEVEEDASDELEEDLERLIGEELDEGDLGTAVEELVGKEGGGEALSARLPREELEELARVGAQRSLRDGKAARRAQVEEAVWDGGYLTPKEWLRRSYNEEQETLAAKMPLPSTTTRKFSTTTTPPNSFFPSTPRRIPDRSSSALIGARRSSGWLLSSLALASRGRVGPR